MRLLNYLSVIVVSILFATYALAIIMGLALFFSTPAGLSYSYSSLRPYVLFLVYGFYTPFTITAGQLFIFIWSFFILCFLLSWRLRNSFCQVLRKFSSVPASRFFNNSLFALPLVACALFAAVTLIINLQDIAGFPTGYLPAPQTASEYFEQYLDVSYAPIVEEIGFRIAPIGAFLVVYIYMFRGFERTLSMTISERIKLFVYLFLYPDGAKRMVGQNSIEGNGIVKGITRAEWSILLITSLIFGIAHIISGIGWEIGKVTSTSVQGFIFGFMYLVYGFQAPILLHWFFNYYFYTFDLSAQYYPSLSNLPDWIENITLALGTAILIWFAVYGLLKISQRKKASIQESRNVKF